MIKYEDLKIDDIILIPKGTDVFSIKLQQMITLYENITVKIKHTVYDKGAIFVMPQEKVIPIMYLDFHYGDDIKKETKQEKPKQEYKDNTTFGELSYVYNKEKFTNNDRLFKLNDILNDVEPIISDI